MNLHVSFSSCVDMRTFTRTTRGNSSPKFAMGLRVLVMELSRGVDVLSARMLNLVGRDGHTWLIEREEDLRILRRESHVALDDRVMTPPTVSIRLTDCQHNSLGRRNEAYPVESGATLGKSISCAFSGEFSDDMAATESIASSGQSTCSAPCR